MKERSTDDDNDGWNANHDDDDGNFDGNDDKHPLTCVIGQFILELTKSFVDINSKEDNTADP